MGLQGPPGIKVSISKELCSTPFCEILLPVKSRQLSVLEDCKDYLVFLLVNSTDSERVLHYVGNLAKNFCSVNVSFFLRFLKNSNVRYSRNSYLLIYANFIDLLYINTVHASF